MRRAALVYNPAAGRRRHRKVLPRLIETLERSGFDAEPRPTAGPGDATRLAREAAAEGLDTVLVFGGDGTVREAAVGLLGSETALGIVPGGTANVLIQALGLPPRALAVAARLGELSPRPFDVGLAGSTPFLMMASSGLDADVMSDLDPLLRRLGKTGIVLDGLRHWWRYGYPEIRVTADGEPLAGTLVSVQNIPLYGGAIPLLPQARWDDRRLDLFLFRGRGRAATLACAGALLARLHLRRRDVEVRRVEEVVLDGPAPLQVDGDGCAEPLPVRIALAPQRLRLLAP